MPLNKANLQKLTIDGPKVGQGKTTFPRLYKTAPIRETFATLEEITAIQRKLSALQRQLTALKNKADSLGE